MILRRGLAHYRLDKSLRPRLENIDFSPQILESCGRETAKKVVEKTAENVVEMWKKRSKNEKTL